MPRLILNLYQTMKKIILSLAAIFAFGAASAQEVSSFGFGQGDVFVEGNLKFSATKSSGNVKTTEFEFAPAAGYFLSDDFALGLGLTVASLKESTSGTDTKKASAFGVDVFGRYYFLELGQRFKTYGQAGVGFAGSNDKLNDLKSTAIGAGVGLGINYFLTEKLAINFALTDLVSFTSSKPKGGSASTSFDLNVNEFNNFFGSNATFGLTYKF